MIQLRHRIMLQYSTLAGGRKVPKRTWFILGALWLVLSVAYFVTTDRTMYRNVASIACGYPDAPRPAFDACIAARVPRVDAAMWRDFLPDHGLWIVVPALVLGALGFALRARA